MVKKRNVAVVGATGAVGRQMVKILIERNFPIGELRLLASARSRGHIIDYDSTPVSVDTLTGESLRGVDIALFSAGSSVSSKFAPMAAADGTVVIDNSSCFRMHPEVPLVVPEVNPEQIAGHNGIIANPNCSTIQMVMALAPIHKLSPIKRIVVSTYQSVSGTGQKAIEELEGQVGNIQRGLTVVPEAYPHQIAYNCIPQIDVFMENDYTKEEMKMVEETRKILGSASISINATAVRVPVFRAHSESVCIETESPLAIADVRLALQNAAGVTLQDDPARSIYPLAVNAEGMDDTYVGRLRKDLDNPCGISMWIVSDNLRKGAALNAVQIAEHIIGQ